MSEPRTAYRLGVCPHGIYRDTRCFNCEPDPSHPLPSEPDLPALRTDAGKRLDSAWPGTNMDRIDWHEAVAAVEAEASGLRQEAARDALTLLDAARQAGVRLSATEAKALAAALAALAALAAARSSPAPAGTPLTAEERERAIQIAATAPDTEVGRLIVRLVAAARSSPAQAEGLREALWSLHEQDREADGNWCSVDHVSWPCPTAELLAEYGERE